MEDKYFFNTDLNICAELEWVTDYLVYNAGIDRKEATENLMTKREYEGWSECSISDTIADLMRYR